MNGDKPVSLSFSSFQS